VGINLHFQGFQLRFLDEQFFGVVGFHQIGYLFGHLVKLAVKHADFVFAIFVIIAGVRLEACKGIAGTGETLHFLQQDAKVSGEGADDIAGGQYDQDTAGQKKQKGQEA